jgi:hypothetical protein
LVSVLDTREVLILKFVLDSALYNENWVDMISQLVLCESPKLVYYKQVFRHRL